ncbi:MAG TPA: CBS domain-containing protein [Polyangiaceae bacterium]|nr:CBS domain-containing protein [Polyangiaceae bacterium]
MSRPSRRPASQPDTEASEFESLRDELRSRLKLASKEAQKQWELIEERLIELERGLEHQSGGVKETASDVAVSVARVFRDFMLRHLPDSGPFRAPVHDAMRTRVYVCAPDDTLARAAQLMWEKDLGALPVCTTERKVVAMLTDRDISMAAFMQWKHLAEASVESAMSRGLCTCSPDDELGLAEDIMRKNQVRRLPVIDESGVLVGLLSLGDIARYVRQHARGNGNQAQQRLADTLAAICEPRFHSIPPPPPPST